MFCRTSLADIGSDSRLALETVKEMERKERRNARVVLVGHSSGGGVAQWAMAK